MNNLTVICLTKTYDLVNFEAWLNHYNKLNCNIIIYDNESEVDIKPLINKYKVKYKTISGWPNQWELFSNILNNNELNFKDMDYITFLDDDEYLWFDTSSYSSINESLDHYFKDLDCLLAPEILLSTKRLKTRLNDTFINECYYRRNDFASQGKAIIRFNTSAKYNFNHNQIERGHVPFINNIRMSEVISDNPGSNISKTTYGITGYNCGLRLYHYHIKSEYDWEKKIARGSAATKNDSRQNGSYDNDIKKNKKFGNYTVPDLSMKMLNIKQE